MTRIKEQVSKNYRQLLSSWPIKYSPAQYIRLSHQGEIRNFALENLDKAVKKSHK